MMKEDLESFKTLWTWRAGLIFAICAFVAVETVAYLDFAQHRMNVAAIKSDLGIVVSHLNGISKDLSTATSAVSRNRENIQTNADTLSGCIVCHHSETTRLRILGSRQK